MAEIITNDVLPFKKSKQSFFNVFLPEHSKNISGWPIQFILSFS